ncbi:predicted protein [Verticillium alfalfae VaMs.102]|uniref:Predicted protein n=1 Tax=Verticillium alfalfae (strain VaMs.102 / ATCC MYA-4576 / FGSC 10136) TaxID=526221 RepID=C9SU34_VERA1|nr:predicted protein [Verticillium alfalfae VaMs.102]EEY22345.1 predicted protein [Verticillium alfalfae VaMs.102]
MCLPSFRRKKQAPAPVEQTFNVLNRDLTPAVLTKHNAVHGGPANTNSAVTEWSYNRTSAKYTGPAYTRHSPKRYRSDNYGYGGGGSYGGDGGGGGSGGDGGGGGGGGGGDGGGC